MRSILVRKALGGPPTPPCFVQGLFPRVRPAGTLYSKALLPTMATPALCAPATPPKLKFYGSPFIFNARFEARVKELIENLPDLAVLVEPLLVVRRVLREQLGILHRRLLAVVRDDDVCRRMTVPGVGPVVALTYRATVDVPARFRKSKSVGAVFGLTCAKYQSGESERTGAISRCGDEMMRTMLYEAAQSMLFHSTKWSWLKAWAMKIARHRGMKKAINGKVDPKIVPPRLATARQGSDPAD